jgi:hypothetical protein
MQRMSVKTSSGAAEEGGRGAGGYSHHAMPAGRSGSACEQRCREQVGPLAVGCPCCWASLNYLSCAGRIGRSFAVKQSP